MSTWRVTTPDGEEIRELKRDLKYAEKHHEWGAVSRIQERLEGLQEKHIKKHMLSFSLKPSSRRQNTYSKEDLE